MHSLEPQKPAVAINEEHAVHVDAILKEILYGEHYTIAKDIAQLKDGIRKLNRTQRARFKHLLRKRSKKYSYTHFIPASGSGSRLFKSLILFTQEYNPDEESFSSYVNRSQAFSLNELFHNYKELPFYDHIKEDIAQINLGNIATDEKKLLIAKVILENNEIDLCKLPKALVPIHKYKSRSATAFEEQIACFTKMQTPFKKTNLHFTINEAHRENFIQALSQVQDAYKDKKLNVDFSVQDASTNVYCIDEENNLSLDGNGKPVKRPSGHGALLNNLNDIDATIVHISNIDNISCSKYHKNYTNSRKVLSGYLIFCVERIHFFLNKLEEGELDDKRSKQLGKFLKKYFHLDLEDILLRSKDGYRSTIYNLLNRPIRICGMVANDGAPGGAPYWHIDESGKKTLQIIEAPEVNTKIPRQREMLENGTHFNPVDMVLFKKDYKGESFDLKNYASEKPSMLVTKTENGKTVKYLERAGLWNGGMRNHLTMFIEVNKNTFNPIKEVTDVLKKHHAS